MQKINSWALAGVVLNVCMAVYLYDAYGSIAPKQSLIGMLAVGLAVSIAGVAMLAKGNPAGGIVGAIGSVLFIPLGLVCLYGCMQQRAALRFGPYLCAPAKVTDTPQKKTKAVFPVHDETVIGGIVLLVGVLLVIFVDKVGATPAMIGLIVVLRSQMQKNRIALALYPDRLEGTPSPWFVSASIPYANLVSATVESSKARLTVRTDHGEDTLIWQFGLMNSKDKELARSQFAEKMQELGLLKGD